MALQFIDKLVIGAIISDAWQNHLDTEMDPANGQWYAQGPNNNGGLFGQLTDALAKELILEKSKQIFSKHKEAVATGIADNRNGNTPNMTLSLSYGYSGSTTTSHSDTNGLKIGAQYSISGKGAFIEQSFSISAEYSHSWTKSESTTEGKTITQTQTIPITIPKGKVHQVSIMCDRCEFVMPYYADVILRGTSRTNFATKVNGKTTWEASAGDICDWIKKFGSSKQDVEFLRNPANTEEGLARVKGTITAANSVNFITVTEDITASYTGEVPKGIVVAQPS